ncbi:hypothetical protein [Rhodococcus opacus]|uniref:SnoaL-like domain-containing protein n=1 Tax=Rhodococcus opacus TaxID=37919 RepID=A0A076EZS8_RHOOP|nr:hypothetical protein [Rhodococcus opacus]AII10933.1 hypothetical protein EP51_43190 [Rhodococcus opacus]
MSKQDIASTISAQDEMLKTLTDPYHRQIIENYRRHAILEICGEWEGIFDADMTVENPLYYFNILGFDGVSAEGDQVKAVYKHLAETDTSVMLLDDERLMVSDWGLASEAIFNSYMRGRDVIERGLEGADPEGYYILRQHYAMIWPYDERGRLIGEHVYENKARRELIEIAPEDFVTLDEVKAVLMPLLRPLPKYDPATRYVAADH